MVMNAARTVPGARPDSCQWLSDLIRAA
jgi:hypothetical protein